MTTLSNEAIIAIAEAACAADAVSVLGHYQTVRDRFIQQEEMLPIVREAVQSSGFLPGDTYCWDLAQHIAEQLGQALAENMVQDINDQLEEIVEELGAPQQ